VNKLKFGTICHKTIPCDRVILSPIYLKAMVVGAKYLHLQMITKN